MRQLSKEEMKEIVGREPITLSGALLYVAIAAGVTAIIKMLTSGRGRVKLPGIQLEWNG